MLASERLTFNVTHSHQFRVSRRISCYLANDGEIDPQAVMERMWDMRKTCYLPVLPRLSGDYLWFAPAEPGTPLAQNRFGIPEPVVPARDLVRAQQLDLVLLPLVGFDENGNRLGMGGGFYDRSLLFLRNRKIWRKPNLIGIAHDFQRVDSLAAKPWDMPLDTVITDRAVYTISYAQSPACK